MSLAVIVVQEGKNGEVDVSARFEPPVPKSDEKLDGVQTTALAMLVRARDLDPDADVTPS